MTALLPMAAGTGRSEHGPDAGLRVRQVSRSFGTRVAVHQLDLTVQPGQIVGFIGTDGALYVAEGGAGRVTRIDPRTGATTTFASGLPRLIPAVGLGGAMDVVFLGRTAYVLVTLVDPAVGGSDVDGIYRVDGPSSFTVVADIGQFAIANPPDTDFFVPTGLQYAMEPYRGGFVVTDGHHNRVYRVTLDGGVRELIAFGNIVPTGLEVRGRTIYMAEAGPVPHLPEAGKVVRFGPRSATATEVASGVVTLAGEVWKIANVSGPPHRG